MHGADPTAAGVIYLRCFVPYTHCRIGQPLSLAGIAAVIGPRCEIQLEPPAGVDASERDPAAAARP
jgi:hypothetical protein